MKTIRRFSARQAATVWWIVSWVGTWGTVLGADAGLTLLGEWPGYSRGPADAVAVSGNYAYVAAGRGGLVVIDVSDPANPQRVGGYDTSGSAGGVAVSGNYAYVVTKDLQVMSLKAYRTRLSHLGGQENWLVEEFSRRMGPESQPD